MRRIRRPLIRIFATRPLRLVVSPGLAFSGTAVAALGSARFGIALGATALVLDIVSTLSVERQSITADMGATLQDIVRQVNEVAFFHASEALGADGLLTRTALHLWDDRHDRLTVLAFHPVAQFDRVEQDAVLAAGQGLAGWAVEAGRSVTWTRQEDNGGHRGSARDWPLGLPPSLQRQAAAFSSGVGIPIQHPDHDDVFIGAITVEFDDRIPQATLNFVAAVGETLVAGVHGAVRVMAHVLATAGP